MEDIYKTPEANLAGAASEKKYDFQLFKISGIGLATFFATTLAGGILIAMNFKRLGKEAKAKNAIIYSIIATIAIFFIAFIIPEDMNIPNTVFTVVQVVVMVQLAKQLQQSDIREHVSNGGELASNWKAFGISILVLLAIIAALIPVIMLFIQ